MATYQNISCTTINNLSKKGQILALIPKQRTLGQHSFRQRHCMDMVENVIVNSTLFVNENRGQKIQKYISNEQDEIDQKIAEVHIIPDAGISPELKISKYDREKRTRIAETRKMNNEFIELKHWTWMKNLGLGRTMSERQENQRETRRKINMEKMQLQQFGEIEGCMKQMDRLK